MNVKTKKVIYLIMWVVTGILLAILIGGIIEAISLWYLDRISITVVLYSLLVIMGMVFGLVCGPLAWKMIYVDGVRGKKYVIKSE